MPNRRQPHRRVVAVLGAMTAAQTAARALARAAIRAEIIKVDDIDPAGRGCGWGVVVWATQLDNVKTVLSAARIYVKRYTTLD